MANAHRGDVDLTVGGVTRTLRLTLQSLAEMEAAFEVGDLVELGSRLSTGRLSAGDLIRIVGPAMRGGGSTLCDAEIAALLPASELETILASVVRLLGATFGGPPENPTQPQDG